MQTNISAYYMEIIWRIRKFVSEKFFRSQKVKNMQGQLQNSGFTLISSNCVGGLLYHDLNHQFMSPTINLFFSAEDFIKFCENMSYYLSLDMQKADENKGYPIGQLGDIEVHLLHYKSFEEAKQKWDERKKRINLNNMFFVFTDRDGFYDDLLERYDKLPYKKVFFSHKKYDKYNFACYMPEFKNKSCVDDLSRYANMSGDKNYEKHFDFIKWVNGQETINCIR